MKQKKYLQTAAKQMTAFFAVSIETLVAISASQNSEQCIGSVQQKC